MASNTTHELCAFTTGEPSLEDLFAEPIVQLFMKRDQIDPQDIRSKLHGLLDSRRLASA